MSLALILGAMALAAAALPALPLIRKVSDPVDRAVFDRAVFSDQLRELERDRARGVIGEEEARAARIEIERRILATAPGPGDSAADARPEAEPFGHTRTPLLTLAVLVPAVAAGLYLLLGAPGLPGQPFAERVQAEATPPGLTKAKIARMVAMLEQRLAEKPEEIEGWILLTTTYLRLDRPTDADRALDRALELAADDKSRAAAIAANYGEALVAMAQGRVTPRAKAVFERALALAPKEPAAAYYLGLARLQAGDNKGALAIWRRLEAAAPADAPWLPGLKQRIQDAAKDGGNDSGDPGAKPRR